MVAGELETLDPTPSICNLFLRYLSNKNNDANKRSLTQLDTKWRPSKVDQSSNFGWLPTYIKLR